MTTDTVPQTVLFPDLFDKPLFAKFDQEQASSDGGAVLLKAAERVYGLVKAFARCLSDKRAPEKIRHTLADLIGQRIFGIACGHPDCNDAEHLADDPIHKLLLGRDPVAGESLASQPTLSRFENAAGRGALYDMGCELAARVVERHRRRLGRVRRITIDLDPTDDPTHGAQQYSLFNGYYDNWCYLPLLAFLTFDREPEQYRPIDQAAASTEPPRSQEPRPTVVWREVGPATRSVPVVSLSVVRRRLGLPVLKSHVTSQRWNGIMLGRPSGTAGVLPALTPRPLVVRHEGSGIVNGRWKGRHSGQAGDHNM